MLMPVQGLSTITFIFRIEIECIVFNLFHSTRWELLMEIMKYVQHFVSSEIYLTFR